MDMGIDQPWNYVQAGEIRHRHAFGRYSLGGADRDDSVPFNYDFPALDAASGTVENRHPHENPSVRTEFMVSCLYHGFRRLGRFQLHTVEKDGAVNGREACRSQCQTSPVNWLPAFPPEQPGIERKCDS